MIGLTIMLVEDHELLADSLATALRADGFVAVLPSAIDVDTVVTTAAAHRPDVVLLDLRLDERGTTSLPLVAPLRELGASVLVVTGETSRTMQAEFLEAGALGVVSKQQPFDQLVAAVREAAQLRSLLGPQERDDLLAELRRQRMEDTERLAPFEDLTPKEREVLAALVDGLTAENIAEQSFVSMATVRTHIRSVLAKLGVRSQLAAVAAARRARWTP